MSSFLSVAALDPENENTGVSFGFSSVFAPKLKTGAFFSSFGASFGAPNEKLGLAGSLAGDFDGGDGDFCGVAIFCGGGDLAVTEVVSVGTTSPSTHVVPYS